MTNPIYVLALTDTASLEEGKHLPLFHSLQHYGHTLTVLPTYDRRYRNLSKIFAVHDYLIDPSSGLKDHDIIVTCDAFDVLFTGMSSLDSVRTLLTSRGLDYIVSSESKCSRHDIDVKKHFALHHDGSFVNSGVQAGYRWAFIALYGHIRNNMDYYGRPANYSDQRIVGRVLMEKEMGSLEPSERQRIQDFTRSALLTKRQKCPKVQEGSRIEEVRMGLDEKYKLSFTYNSVTKYGGELPPSLFVHITMVKSRVQHEKYVQICKALEKQGKGPLPTPVCSYPRYRPAFVTRKTAKT